MKALISGISGQDGSYLAEFLLARNYQVFGLERRVALEDQKYRRRKDVAVIIPCDITNYSSVFAAVQQIMPDEIYHLAAQSDVGYSFKDPFQTLDTNVIGTMNMLEAFRQLVPRARFYFAGTSEIFGSSPPPQNELTPMRPRSPYGVAKLAGFHLVRNYRESYGLFACSGILFNHESPRRGKEFVTRKITSTLAKIVRGEETKIRLGNLDTRRDWGYAGDYVEAMWLMLQQPKPDDYVIATNETHSIKEFLNEAFKQVGLDWEEFVEQDPQFVRPADVQELQGDYSKAERVLGWKPRTKFKDLVKMMVEADTKPVEMP